MPFSSRYLPQLLAQGRSASMQVQIPLVVADVHEAKHLWLCRMMLI